MKLPEKIRKDFSVLRQKVNNKPLIYLDNGASSLTPDCVIAAMDSYYKEYRSNVHRGLHSLSEKATIEYEKARQKVISFINAEEPEVIWTKGTTESINLLAYTFSKKLVKGDEILLTEMEHHSNLVPWQQVCKHCKIQYIKVTPEGYLDLNDFKKKLNKKTKIVSLTLMSNVLGTINDVKMITEEAHKVNALVIVDGAQGIPHLPIDVKVLDCDFLAFSGHKMLGPTGIGVLYGKKKHLQSLDPFLYGGDMISEVQFSHSFWNDLPWKFEAGTPQIAEAIGFGRAIEYLQSIGMKNIQEYEEEITKYALEKLQKIKGLKIQGPKDSKNRGSVFSFTIEGIHPHDLATILDREGIAVRAGNMCAMPLVTEVLKVGSVCRASFYCYNTFEEVDALVKALQKAQEIFHGR